MVSPICTLEMAAPNGPDDTEARAEENVACRNARLLPCRDRTSHRCDRGRAGRRAGGTHGRLAEGFARPNRGAGTRRDKTKAINTFIADNSQKLGEAQRQAAETAQKLENAKAK